MKKLAFAVCLGMLSISLFGQLPKTLSFQGYLTNADGEPITNSALEVSFSLYSQKTGGSLVWGPETHQVNVDKGIFNTILGASQITAVPLDFGGSLTFDQKYFLEIVINPNGAAETLTRIELTSSMFSLSTLNATNITSGTLSGALLDEVDVSILSGSVAIANGGTGAADATSARTNLGLAIGSNVQAYDVDLDDLADGVLSGAKVGTGIDATNITANSLAIANGGTGAATATAARDNLGLTIGTNVQAYDADLTTYAGITPGTDIQTFLGSANNSTARTNLGLAIGSDVQGYDAGLADVAGLTATDGNIIVGDGTNWIAESGATARASLGLVIGTDVQTQSSYLDDLVTDLQADNLISGATIGTGINADNITSGTLTVGNGGTGVTDLEGVVIGEGNGGAALSGYTAATANVYLRRNSTNTDYEFGVLNGSHIANSSIPITKLTGTIPVSSGGTGATTLSGIVRGNGTGSFDAISTAAPQGYVLARTGATDVGFTQISNASVATAAAIAGSKIDPDFGSQDIATTGTLDVGGYTTLGDDVSAPAIKMKTLSGTIPAFEGFDTGVTHGVTQSKIISVQVLVDNDPTGTVVFIPPNYSTDDEAESTYSWYLTSTQVRIVGHSTKSGDLLSNAYKVLIIYTE